MTPVPLLVTTSPWGPLVSEYPVMVSGTEDHITETWTPENLKNALDGGALLVHSTANSIRIARSAVKDHYELPDIVTGELFDYLTERLKRHDQRATTNE